MEKVFSLIKQRLTLKIIFALIVTGIVVFLLLYYLYFTNYDLDHENTDFEFAFLQKVAFLDVKKFVSAGSAGIIKTINDKTTVQQIANFAQEKRTGWRLDKLDDFPAKTTPKEEIVLVAYTDSTRQVPITQSLPVGKNYLVTTHNGKYFYHKFLSDTDTEYLKKLIGV